MYFISPGIRLGYGVVERFLSEGLVYPPVLKKGLFTTAAVDNIDHNPSSTTAKTSFHGTGISIFQHPSDDISGIERGELILGNRSNSRQVSSLPDTYANVRPAYLKTKPKPPNSPDTILKLTDHDYLKQSLQCMCRWWYEIDLVVSDSEV
ncbi:Hypothetical predicted protein [Mytilus galloprovincialis]|uniref:Uncharacterized protein n=1 Tax=Mytilus galloprovincialis TaxID=29158 RepID=A0A8B6DRS8_MYTGA|nr:Hypothetical predicted protein [Mytilus galloprovincialis]